jgi:two-component system, OmpR family, response regulator VicR
MEHKPLTTGEVAQYCHVTHRAVLKWVASGKLKAYRTPGNHSRVKHEDFMVFLKTYNMPVPEAFEIKGTLKKILIIDDDRGIVHSLQRALVMENKYEIQTAFDGFTGGQKFAEFKPDLVILDIYMPGLEDGFKVCSHIRAEEANKNVKILIISGVSEETEIKKIMKLGANDYLIKPFSNQALHDKIKLMLGENHES